MPLSRPSLVTANAGLPEQLRPKRLGEPDQDSPLGGPAAPAHEAPVLQIGRSLPDHGAARTSVHLLPLLLALLMLLRLLWT